MQSEWTLVLSLIDPEKMPSLEKILTLWDGGFGGDKKKKDMSIC